MPLAPAVAMLGPVLVMIFAFQQQIFKLSVNARLQRNNAMLRTLVLMECLKVLTVFAWQQLACVHAAGMLSDVLTPMTQAKTFASQNPLVLAS
jgi:hypothetical protein